MAQGTFTFFGAKLQQITVIRNRLFFYSSKIAGKNEKKSSTPEKILRNEWLNVEWKRFFNECAIFYVWWNLVLCWVFQKVRANFEGKEKFRKRIQMCRNQFFFNIYILEMSSFTIYACPNCFQSFWCIQTRIRTFFTHFSKNRHGSPEQFIDVEVLLNLVHLANPKRCGSCDVTLTLVTFFEQSYLLRSKVPIKYCIKNRSIFYLMNVSWSSTSEIDLIEKYMA